MVHLRLTLVHKHQFLRICQETSMLFSRCDQHEIISMPDCNCIIQDEQRLSVPALCTSVFMGCLRENEHDIRENNPLWDIEI